MFERLESVVQKFRKLEEDLSNPDLLANQEEYRKVAREHADLASIVEAYAGYKSVQEQIRDNQELLDLEDDADMRELIRQEVTDLKKRLESLETELKSMLAPRDPNDDKNVILEIRAGTGGDEAALFVADLFRMYTRYAEMRRWKVEILDTHPTGIGGFKEIIAAINGKGAFSRLKYERGVHRVQRVPVTESQGRIHTSAVTVAVLPEAEEVDVYIDPNDIRVDVFRSSGPGGQSVNTTDSAVRITHTLRGLSSFVRTKNLNTRTRPRHSRCFAPGCWTRCRANRKPGLPRTARARWDRETGANAYEPTIFPRTAFPTIAST